jgi:hypothetical protein
MSQRIVFLDRASLAATVRQPRGAVSYVEHAATTAAEVIARLQGREQHPQLRHSFGTGARVCDDIGAAA